MKWSSLANVPQKRSTSPETSMKTALPTTFSVACSFCASLMALFPGFVSAQSTISPRAHLAAPDLYKVIAEGNQSRVMEVVLRPGQRDPIHSHPSGTAIYFVTACSLKVTQFGVDVDTYPAAGTARIYGAIGSHSTLNVGKSDCKMVIVEPQ
jgi:hypothetical protein